MNILAIALGVVSAILNALFWACLVWVLASGVLSAVKAEHGNCDKVYRVETAGIISLNGNFFCPEE